MTNLGCFPVFFGKLIEIIKKYAVVNSHVFNTKISKIWIFIHQDGG